MLSKVKVYSVPLLVYTAVVGLNCGELQGSREGARCTTQNLCIPGLACEDNLCVRPVPPCQAESDDELCRLADRNCGPLNMIDSCGIERSIVSCGTCSGSETCGGGGVSNRCGCTPEDNLTFCSRLGATCGALTGTDNCGATRSNPNCGSCNFPQSCGGGGIANQCGGCTSETDLAFCQRLKKNCGTVDDFDNCERSRSVACGTCSGIDVCGASVANVCGHVTQIDAGEEHTCALFSGGDVRCWGRGEAGRLGYGNTNDVGDNETPASVGNVDIGAPAVKISAGGSHTCAILIDGKVRCWGSGAFGQLGYGNTENIGDDEPPSSAGDVSLSGTALHISAGRFHTCVVLSDNSVQCWGDGASGRLGYGNTDTIGNDELPSSVGVVNVGEPVSEVVASVFHTCALLTNGYIRCWGNGSNGILGYGNTTSIGNTPENLPFTAGNVGLSVEAEQVTAGLFHTCANLITGVIQCWGASFSGQLGYGSTTTIGDDEPPTSGGNVSFGGSGDQITAGSDHTCTILTNGRVSCWGSGLFGRLGYGSVANIGDNEMPSSVGLVDLGDTATQVTAGNNHTCALLTTGGVRCWGNGANGKLGNVSLEDIGDELEETPATTEDIPLFP